MIFVLYEDSLARGGRPPNYGPHAFVKQCVVDAHPEIAPDHWSLRNIEARPMRGATKLRAQAPKLVSSGHRVVAVHDRDHVHEFVEMSHAACRVQLVTALAEGCERTRLRVVLLDRNLETLFETLRARQVSLARTDEWQSVIAKKDLNLRDRILLRATHAEHKTLRTQIREAMPSFDYFVRTLCELLPW